MDLHWEDRIVGVAGHRLLLRSAGPDNGETQPAAVVVLHDAGAESIDAPAWALVAAFRPIIQVLLPGVGQSDPVPEGVDLAWITDLLAGLLRQQLPGPTHLIGTSLGGWFAVETALAHPGHVTGLLLLDSAGLQWPSHYLFALFADGQGIDGHDGLLRPLMRAHRTPEEPAAMAPYVAGMTAAALQSWNAHVHDPSLLSRLPALQAPTTIMWGETDALIPVSHGHAMAEAIGQGTCVEVVPGAGHLLAVDAPEAVASRLRPGVLPSGPRCLWTNTD